MLTMEIVAVYYTEHCHTCTQWGHLLETKFYFAWENESAVEPGYNYIGLYDTSSIASDILWYQLIPRG
jgi:hypothetical protein